ncbi:MAG: KpsF/GutQ family sugar-phosphate isomerase [Succinivibrionaceae bacterium]|nr:KpsF/GutQ family sugar-phosphate isomerase [Succinivibrionaceae bacterium]
MAASDKPFNFSETGVRVLHEEIQALHAIEPYIRDSSFAAACEAILQVKGKVIVTGMGKSGHIASKIAATMASTGTPSFFVHPGEAAHGDLGMIGQDDLVIAISNSGESSEILTLIPVLKRLDITLICMTGNPSSTMASECDIHLCIHVAQEACPLNLAPTSSTTTSLVMGDALAIALLEAKGFTANDFAMSHPGGALGRRLLLRNCVIMHTGDSLPVVTKNTSIKKALFEMTSKGLGMVAVVNDDKTVYGLFTDGDLRRVLDRDLSIQQPIVEVIRQGCITVPPDMLAAKSLEIMQSYRINGLLVVDEKNSLVGAFNMHDLLVAGVF